jgi:hypothetical protein
MRRVRYETICTEDVCVPTCRPQNQRNRGLRNGIVATATADFLRVSLDYSPTNAVHSAHCPDKPTNRPSGLVYAAPLLAIYRHSMAEESGIGRTAPKHSRKRWRNSQAPRTLRTSSTDFAISDKWPSPGKIYALPFGMADAM